MTTSLWHICEGCQTILYQPRFARALGVCPDCGRHARVGATDRLAQLLDPGSAELLPMPDVLADPLEFTDSKPYPARLEEARRATGQDEAIVCARGLIDGRPVIAAVMDFAFLGGSLGSAVGEAITTAAETALEERTPLLIVSASGGARMQEGALSLMQMAKTSGALARLDEAGVLTISLVTDPTYGGVAASYATLCDVILAEPGARLGFAGPRVIAQTIRQSLPPGFQTAEFLLEHGLIDGIVPRAAVRPTLARLLRMGRPARDGGPAVRDAAVVREAPVVRDPGRLPEHDPWETVRLGRHLDRPTALDHLASVFDDFLELRGDRLGGDCPAIVGGFALLGDVPVMAVGTQKGHDPRELTARGFGMATPAGYRKAARLMLLAAKLGLPIVTLVDTPGAFPGLAAEEHGQAMAIAENIRLMASLPVPIVTVITGEGGSGGALALAVANRVLIFSNGTYSVISPEGCASILWKDTAAAPKAARNLRIDARELLRLGIVDGVVPEPPGGAHLAPGEASRTLRAALTGELAALLGRPAGELLAQRHERFRSFGTPPDMDDPRVERDVQTTRAGR
ncbi:acetyl-CoA carboxylase, carboxyltransferase subunit beta [Actinomadura sp. NPDC048394]|uniref:acetyl-CoA carboxylase, carboxyltransferase subunit beta n=1 Tax=Actinomadura sp. NPDC048394 TaxID=3158223 RepID=UPI0033E3D96A